MKKWLQVFTLISTLFCFSLVVTAQQKSKASVTIHFDNRVGKENIHPDSVYHNEWGEDFTITKLKYYITNIYLLNTVTGAKQLLSADYFLIDETKPASKQIQLIVPAGTYNAISFLSGVDSIKNVSGAQSGALDPANDMFWTWNSGYVMMKMEGISSLSHLPQHRIEYHIGGYMGKNKVQEQLVLYFPKSASIPFKAGESTNIVIAADLQNWFSRASEIHITDTPACTTPGELAKKIARNYYRMFSVVSVGFAN